MKHLASLLLIVATAIAQAVPYRVDCSKLPAPSAGCESYNEMILSNDKDLIGVLRANTSFICFRPAEDVFFTLSYTDPDYDGFVRVGSTNMYDEDAFLYYARFKNGLSDDFEMVIGKWRKFSKDGATPFFVSPKGAPDSLEGTVSEAEIGFHYSFKNLSTTQTHYFANIRRSTLRFVETYEWEDSQQPKLKSKDASQADTAERAKHRNEITGHCAFFSDNNSEAK